MNNEEELLESIWELMKNDEDIRVTPKICCENQSRYTTHENVVCENCGVILDAIISDNREHDISYDEFKPNINQTAGIPTNPLIPNTCMNSTVIAGNSNMSKAQKWLNNSAISYNEKVLLRYKYKINNLVNTYNIVGDISTGILYKIKELIDFKEKNSIIHRGRIYHGLIAVCFYYSGKENGYNIPPMDIAKMFEIDIKTFNKCCDIYTELIQNKNGNMIKNNDGNSLLIRLFGSFGLSTKIVNLAKNIMTSADELYVTQGITPQSNIAGILEFLKVKLNLEIETQDICDVTKVKISTLKKVSKVYLDNELKIYNYMKFHM